MAFDRSQLAEIAQGAAKLRDAIKGLSPADLQARPGPGKWSIHEVIVHLCDADQALSFRVKQILAEDRPTLQAWDETKFVEKLDYHSQSIETALCLIDCARKQIASILQKQPDAAFARTGNHSERGTQTLEQIAGFFVAHLEHHLRFILGKRANLKK